MKKILCPTDLSAEAINGLEYAANLARKFAGSITLMYVRQSIWPEAIQLERESTASAEIITEKLNLMSEQTRRQFGVPCDHHLEITTGTLEETVSAAAANYDLIVMGTTGADNFYQYVFGSNSFHVIQSTKCPVLLVPAGGAFKSQRMVVYAYDPVTNPIFLIDQLKKIVSPLGTQVRVVHIEEDEPTQDTVRKVAILRDAILLRAPKNITWSFDCPYAKDVPWALDQYVKTEHADMLALSFHHRTLMEKLFTENVIRRMALMAEYPVFVFWH